MRRFTRIALGCAALVALAALVPYGFDASGYKSAVETEMTRRLEVPVSIGALRFALLPVPQLVARSIAIGVEHEVKIDEVRIRPALLSLFGQRTVIRSVRANGAVLTPGALALL